MALKLKNTVRNKTPADLLNDEVDLTISKQVVINADIRFKRLVRIDGRFEGKLIPSAEASIIVTRRGHYLGDIIGLNLAYIDGKVEGNIFVHALELGPHANVCGNIFCKRIVIAGHAKFTGDLNVCPANNIPPPPQPPKIDPSLEPETLTETGEPKEVHLVEDDDTLFVAAPTQNETDTKDIDSTELPVLPPRKTNALFIHEPQIDLLASSDLWSEIDSPDSADEQDKAVDRLCTWIEEHAAQLDHIMILLDIHYKPGLNDYLFWKRGSLENNDSAVEASAHEHPEIGTVITDEDIIEKRWIPATESNEVFVQEYLINSQKNSEYDPEDEQSSSFRRLVIKPKHCQIGTTGAAVIDRLNIVINKWSKQQKKEVGYLVAQHKGGSASSPSSSWLYDRNQIEHVASQVDRVFLAGQVLGHCHSFHLVADLAAGMVETLGAGDDKEITVLTDALLITGSSKSSRMEMMDEVIAASQLQQVLLSNTEEVIFETGK